MNIPKPANDNDTMVRLGVITHFLARRLLGPNWKGAKKNG